MSLLLRQLDHQLESLLADLTTKSLPVILDSEAVDLPVLLVQRVEERLHIL
jgi:hypothetical protein